MENEKTSLGLLSLGSRSVQFYNEQIHTLYNEEKSLNRHLILRNITSDFSTINSHLPNQFEHLEPLLQKNLDAAAKEKVNVLIIPNITLHETLDRLTEKSNNLTSIKIAHPLETTVKNLHASNITTVVVIGSAYTSHCDWINSYFALHNIHTIPMSKEHTQQIDLIRQRTYTETETKKDHEDYNNLIDHYQNQAPVVIACTELSILIDDLYKKTIFDMARIQIQTAVNTVQEMVGKSELFY
jgi:aspartate racemase